MGMYGYDYNYGSGVDALGTIAGFFAVFMLAAIVIVLAWTILSYVLYASGLYTIAKRRGIHHAWLAWIPIGMEWLLGSISDQYQFVTKKRNTHRRTTLVVLEIVFVAVYILMCIYGFSMVYATEVAAAALGASMGLYLLSWLLMCVVGITFFVFEMIALNDLFAACDPSNVAVKIVLCILFVFTIPFFVFFSRKKDLGMPPRKAPAPAIPEAEPVAEPAPAEEATEQQPAEEEPQTEAPCYEQPTEPVSEQPVESTPIAEPAPEQPAETEEQPE